MAQARPGTVYDHQMTVLPLTLHQLLLQGVYDEDWISMVMALKDPGLLSDVLRYVAMEEDIVYLESWHKALTTVRNEIWDD